ncbi:MAG: diacylglycerol kinase catalytic region [Candidatus Saccharibacteria bacterium]|nr:diacylglycerol kinase catalytic region [Candidatus Saccharibacteria bacterium]
MKFTDITIIYNPNSTGDSERLAINLQKDLRTQLPKATVQCLPTKYAGHARHLANDIAEATKKPLIISSSGDGGYNEVINGIIDSGNPDAVCAVLPAGNANDHSRTMQDAPLLDLIIKGKVTQIDLLKVVVRKVGGGVTTRYAHSYIGLGLTPVVAVELNKHTLNAFREMLVAIRAFYKYQPFKIEHADTVIKLDSLLFANINQMAKILTLAPKNRPDDGKFELISFPAGHKWQLFKRLAKAAANRLDPPQRISRYQFTALKNMPLQLDGEVMKLPYGSQVTVASAAKALKTII